MLELKLILFVQGLRFLVFDHKLFRGLRLYLESFDFFRTLLTCAFCQGFWLAFFTFLFYGDIVNAGMWGFGSGIISMTWCALVIPKIDEYEAAEAAYRAEEAGKE